MRRSLFFKFDPSLHFDIVTDTGANIKTTAEAVFTNQFEWIKDRDNANNHQLIDSVRGTSAVVQSNSAGAETTYSAPSGNSVGWVWNIPSTGSSNTDGSITSTVSANATAGTSVIAYQGTGANATVGHGLEQSVDFLIDRNRTTAGRNWRVYHKDLTSAAYALYLDAVNAEVNDSTIWNSTAPTSTVFSLGTEQDVNKLNDNHIAFAFAQIDGFSAFGSYTGNTTTEPSITGLGATGSFVIIKRTDSAGNWVMIDSVRGDNYVYANSSASEASANYIDFTSDGFDIATGVTNSDVNANGGTYIYALWA